MVESETARKTLAELIGPIDVPCHEGLIALDTERHSTTGAIVPLQDMYPGVRTYLDYQWPTGAEDLRRKR